jgi:Bacterial Ig-like domain (group 3)/Glycosyl hydrolases family 16
MQTKGRPLFGDQAIESKRVSDRPGIAQAVEFPDHATASATSISVYIDSRNSAKTLVAGLYTDNTGKPGVRLASGSRTSLVAGKWNTVTINATAVNAGQMYWVAVLGKGGDLVIRDSPRRRCLGEASRLLITLPLRWKTVQRGSVCPISAYVSGFAKVFTGPTTPAPGAGTPPGQSPSAPPTQTQAVTTTVLSSSANPSTTGQQVTFTALVSPAPDGGAVQFTDGGTTISACGAVAVNTTTGQATCQVTYNSVGSYAIQSIYSGATSYKGSTSSLLTQTVRNVTSTVLSSSANPSTTGQQVTYTALVSPAPDGGAVQFTDGGTTISACGAVPVNTTTGQATCQVIYTTGASHSIQSTYSGDTNYERSISSTLTETVAAPAPVNTGEPVVTGTVAAGDTLSTTDGTWDNSPTAFSYQWQRCGTDGTGCINISGATSSNYIVASDDAGHTIEAQVTATNSGGSTTANAPIVPLIDNFTSDSGLDTNVWTALNQQGDTSNQEVECFLPSQVSVNSTDGLDETADYIPGGFDCPAGTPDSSNPLNWETASIQMKAVNFQYGTIVVRARMPAAGDDTHPSAWPAIWLLGSECQNSSTSPYTYLSGMSGIESGYYCNWPSDNSGAAEVDISEIVGTSGSDTTSYLQNEYNSDASFSQPCNSYQTNVDLSAGYHDYELDWTPTGMTFKFDGVDTGCGVNADITRPMFLIIDNAICTSGSNCGGDPDTSTFPATMSIAWVRVSH